MRLLQHKELVALPVLAQVWRLPQVVLRDLAVQRTDVCAQALVRPLCVLQLRQRMRLQAVKRSACVVLLRGAEVGLVD